VEAAGIKESIEVFMGDVKPMITKLPREKVIAQAYLWTN
jgi:hypothetical protein